MPAPVQQDDADKLLLSLLKVEFGSTPPYLILLTGTVPEGEDVPFADLVEATFTGYESKPLGTWTDPVMQDDEAMIESEVQSWTNEDDDEDAEVSGWAIIDAEESKVYAVCEFSPGPQTIATGETLSFKVRWYQSDVATA